MTGRYDYGEKGELENYDNKNPIVIELPPTERGLVWFIFSIIFTSYHLYFLIYTNVKKLNP